MPRSRKPRRRRRHRPVAEDQISHPPDAEDRIGDLPDDILISIISLLPAGTLLATSLLSRRWRSLWTFATSLDIDLSVQPKPELFLGRIFSANHSPNLYACRIQNFNMGIPTDEFVGDVTLKRITKLSLHSNTSYSYWPPDYVLTIPTLQQLFLANFTFVFSQPPSTNSIRLRSLRLDNSPLLIDGHLDMLISTAPLLDHLGLIHCENLNNPHIRSQTLKRLEVEYALHLNSLKIDAPLLTTLTLNELPQLRRVIINAPSLTVLNTSTHYIGGEDEHVERRPTQNTFKLLHLLRGPYKLHRNDAIFSRLRKLYISINFSSEVDAKKLAYVLHNCNKLEELGIINNGYLFHWICETYWMNKGPIFCIKNHVECLWIKDFTGGLLELDFITYILSTAQGLKRLSISSRKIQTLEALKSIIVPKSLDLNIIIKHDQ